MLVVDTSIWVDYFNDVGNPQTDFLNTILDKTPIRIGDLILVEVLLGFRQYPDSEKPAAYWANLYRKAWSILCSRYKVRETIAFCVKGGTVCKTIDSLKATFCVEKDHELLHKGSDFDGYEEHLGLRVISSLILSAMQVCTINLCNLPN